MNPRTGTLIDPRNYSKEDYWYRVGDRIAWWDRHTRQWIAYYVESGTPYQRGPCDLYPNSATLIACEADKSSDWRDA